MQGAGLRIDGKKNWHESWEEVRFYLEKKIGELEKNDS